MTNGTVINPTPKARFLANKTETQAHQNLMTRADFQHSIDVALMEYQHRLSFQTPDKEFNACAASHLKMLGAIQFVDTLKRLSQVETPAPVRQSDNLDHNVK